MLLFLYWQSVQLPHHLNSLRLVTKPTQVVNKEIEPYNYHISCHHSTMIVHNLYSMWSHGFLSIFEKNTSLLPQTNSVCLSEIRLT